MCPLTIQTSDSSFRACAKDGSSPRLGTSAQCEELQQRLLSDPLVAKAWDRFSRKNRLTGHIQELLVARLLILKLFADNNEYYYPWRNNIMIGIRREINAASGLLGYYELKELRVAQSVAVAAKHLIETKSQGKACQDALNWIINDMRDLERVVEMFFWLNFPSSQKRNQPHLAFAILACRQFELSFGRPAYDLVTEITRVWYARGETLTVKSIAAAYAVDQKKRLKIQPPRIVHNP